MRVLLIGADVEENLGLGMVAAALLQARHKVRILPYNEAAQLDAVAEEVVRQRPHLVGLGIQFQHRSHDFLLLAGRIRARGYTGHITCGGQYSTLAFAEILTHESAVDSCVLHDGERTSVALADVLASGRPIASVAGLAVRDSGGAPHRTAARPLEENLDSLPFAHRYRAPTEHLGIPFYPIWGSRGCWGACTFCSITTFYRDARRHAGGRALRLRSPENVAAEMAELWHATGSPSIFCFHDDTFLLPRPEDSLNRVRAIRKALDGAGVGVAGLIGKCRPECLTPELARELKALGVFRLYVGIENASQHGQDSLNRRTRTEQLGAALQAMNGADIFGCYNLLIFEPDTTLSDIDDNLAFIKKHPENAVNFCRAEPYHSTPLQLRVKNRGNLSGSYLGWDYRLEDDRVELLFRICSAVFRERNFDPYGVANRYMGLGYMAQVMAVFYDATGSRAQRLIRQAKELTREISLDTVTFLEEALNLVRAVAPTEGDRIERETALLALRIAAHDRLWHEAMDDLLTEMGEWVDQQRNYAAPLFGRTMLRTTARRAMLAGAMALSTQACGSGGEVVDPAPPAGGIGGTGGHGMGGKGTGAVAGRAGAAGISGLSGGWYDPPPPNGGVGGKGGTGGKAGTGAVTGSSGFSGGWYDPPPPNGGVGGKGGAGGKAGAGAVTGSSGFSGGWYDPPPPNGGVGGTGGRQTTGGAHHSGGTSTTGATGGTPPLIVDPAPPGGGWYDPVPMDLGIQSSNAESEPACSPAANRSAAVVDTWRSSSPRRAVRSADLPLFDPPDIKLGMMPEGDAFRVRLDSTTQAAMSIRWESSGTVEGDGPEILWKPASKDDQLRAAVRTVGGVAVATLRAREILG